jgi:hypothetical protein
MADNVHRGLGDQHRICASRSKHLQSSDQLGSWQRAVERGSADRSSDVQHSVEESLLVFRLRFAPSRVMFGVNGNA